VVVKRAVRSRKPRGRAGLEPGGGEQTAQMFRGAGPGVVTLSRRRAIFADRHQSTSRDYLGRREGWSGAFHKSRVPWAGGHGCWTLAFQLSDPRQRIAGRRFAKTFIGLTSPGGTGDSEVPLWSRRVHSQIPVHQVGRCRGPGRSPSVPHRGFCQNVKGKPPSGFIEGEGKAANQLAIGAARDPRKILEAVAGAILCDDGKTESAGRQCDADATTRGIEDVCLVDPQPS